MNRYIYIYISIFHCQFWLPGCSFPNQYQLSLPGALLHEITNLVMIPTAARPRPTRLSESHVPWHPWPAQLGCQEFLAFCLDGLHEVGSSDLDGAYLCTILARAELNVNLKYYWWIRYMDIYIAHRSIRIFMGPQEDIHGAGVFFTCCHRTWAAFRSRVNLRIGVQGSLSDSSNRVIIRIL